MNPEPIIKQDAGENAFQTGVVSGDVFIINVSANSPIQKSQTKWIEDTDSPSLHVAVLAMRRTEAKELLSGNLAFQTQEEQKRFQQIKNSLSDEDILARYSEQRFKWKPFFAQKSIAAMIEEIVNHFNSSDYQTKLRTLPCFQPVCCKKIKFYPIGSCYLYENFFNKNSNTYKDVVEKYGGYILVIDSLSLFFPDLLRFITEKLDFSFVKAMIVVSPVSRETLRINEMIERQIKDRIERLYDRLYEFLDPSIGYIVSDEGALRRRFHLCLPRVLLIEQERNKFGYKQYFQESGIQENGVKQRIIGGSI